MNQFMRFSCLLFMVLGFFHNTSFAGPPPYSSLTISGTAKQPYDKVGLFANGKADKPMVTATIDSKTRQYRINLDTAKNMHRYSGNMIGADMRFWHDKNNNGLADADESKTQCHFILWDSQKNKMVMQVYGGSTYQITSSNFKYNYGRIVTEEVIKVDGLSTYPNASNTSQAMREYPDARSKIKGTLPPNHGYPAVGVLRSGWVVLEDNLYVHNPDFVKTSLSNAGSGQQLNVRSLINKFGL